MYGMCLNSKVIFIPSINFEPFRLLIVVNLDVVMTLIRTDSLTPVFSTFVVI